MPLGHRLGQARVQKMHWSNRMLQPARDFTAWTPATQKIESVFEGLHRIITVDA